MTTQLNSKLITLNSNRKQKRTLRQKGFTLIELMVVTAVAGVLGAVAVPKFLDARKAAETKAIIAEQVGLGKECSTYLTAGGSASGMQTPTNCAGAGADDFTKSMSSGTMIAGVNCLDPSNGGATSANTNTKVTVSVASTGAMTCTLTNS